MMMIVRRLLSLVGLKSRWQRHFSPRPPSKVFFQGGGVAGFVDSWPKTLVPSASSLSTPEWTLVDSCRGDSMKSLALACAVEQRQRAVARAEHEGAGMAFGG